MHALMFFVPSNRLTRTGKPKGLDGLNEIIAANRASMHAGAKLERENLQNVMQHAQAAMIRHQFKPIKGKAKVSIEIVEPNKKRDVSNVIAASKYLLDGITRPRGRKPGIGLIVDDSPRYCELSITVNVVKGKAGAYITVEEMGE